MSPFMNVTVAFGSSIVSRIERPLRTGRKPRSSSSRNGLKYSHLMPARIVRFGFQRQLSCRNAATLFRL